MWVVLAPTYCYAKVQTNKQTFCHVYLQRQQEK